MRGNSFFILFLFILPLFGISQEYNSKTYFKAGRDHILEEQYSTGIKQLSRVIKEDPGYEDAYLYRAKAYEATDSMQLAIMDLNSYIVKYDKDPKPSIYYDLARFYNEVGDYHNALVFATSAITRDKKFIPAYHEKTKALISLKRYEDALETSSQAVVIKDDKENFYYKGLSYYLLGKYELSKGTYEYALRKDSDYIDALVGKAKAFYEMDQASQAYNTIQHALKVDETCKECYVERAKINFKLVRYQEAVNDLSKVIVLHPNDTNQIIYYFDRGKYNAALKKYTDGIADFTQVIAIDNTHALAYYERGLVYEMAFKNEEAVEDFYTFMSFSSQNPLYHDKVADATNRIYNLNKEEDKPEIMIFEPEIRIDNVIDVVKDTEEVILRAALIDASPVKKVTVNGQEVEIIEGFVDKPIFEFKFEVGELDSLIVDVWDIYDNHLNSRYGVRLTEVDNPLVKIVKPYTSDDSNLQLEGTPTRIYIEGYIRDESLIKSITIDSLTNASFTHTEENPSFYGNINIVNKQSFTLRVEDVFGNVTKNTYYFQRGQMNLTEGPMGRSWAFLIANSDYDTFEKLEGPMKDINMMESILRENYNFTNVVLKKNFSKEDFDRFFKITLRELIDEHRINSVLIWYAGHGSLNKNVGFWIPVDGRADDELTHFSLNDLKSSMETYPQDLTHMLVISDACQAGGSLYEATRASHSDKNCNDKLVIESKSTQIVTSADSYDEALDQSKFMDVFYNTLKNNDLSCISIDKIYLEIKTALEMGGKQTPQFSNIKGLKNENGTFFFIKKE